MKTSILLSWIKGQQEEENSVPVVVNGGGFSWLSPDDDAEKLMLEDEDYAENIAYIEKGEEFADFKQLLSPEEYEAVSFVLLKHESGYNEENFDIQVGVWDLPHTVEDVELTKRGYCNDTLTYKADGEEVTVTGEFYVDNSGRLHHSHIFPDGVEVEFTVEYN